MKIHKMFAAVMVMGASLAFAQETPKQDPPKAETPKAEAPKTEAPKVDQQQPPAPPPGQERVEFKFKDMPIEVVLNYVGRVTGYMINNEAHASMKIDAYSETTLAPDEVLSFLNTVLGAKGLATVKTGNTVTILTADEAKKRQENILVVHPDDDEAKFPPTDEVKRIMMPLKNLNVIKVKKELDALFPTELQVTASTDANAFIMNGRARDICKIKTILKVLDVQANQAMEIKVRQLKNADCNEIKTMITDLFIKKDQDQSPDIMGFRGIMQMMARQKEGQGEQKTLASEVVRVVADPRTNSVVIAAIPENLKIIIDMISMLDDNPTAASLKPYHLFNADATAVAKVVNDLFEPKADPAAGAQQMQQQMMRRQMWWMGGAGGQPGGGSEGGGGQQVKAIADTRTNSVIVAAGEKQHETIGKIIEDLDRQVMDILQLRIFPLVNADAAETVATIKEMFRTQSTVSAASAAATTTGGGRNTGGGRGPQGQGGFGGAPQSSGLLPTQVVEVTADARTNSVIAKASPDYMDVIGQLIHDLDHNPTDKDATYVIRLKNGNAQNVADTLKEMITGQARRQQQNQNQQNPFAAFTNQQNAFGTQNQGAGNRSSGSSRGNFRQLGPFDDQEAPFGPQDPQEPPIDETQQQPPPTTGLRGGPANISADSDTNTLVIKTSPRNFAAIQSILNELDRARPQVLIKVLIADMLHEDALALGAEGNKKLDPTQSDSLSVATDFEEFDPARVGAGAFTFNYTGADGSKLRFQALAREGRAKILATPEILVLDNQQANITVGRKVPFIENSQQTQQGGTLNTIRYDDVGIKLSVQPHINPDGIVTMTVQPEVSDIDPTRSVPISEGITSPTFTNNTALTTVSVRNGQTVVIGGLIRDQEEEIEQGIPLLRDIPLIGTLFSRTDTQVQQRELTIFLTPYVVWSQPQLEELSRVERASLRLFDAKDLPKEGRRWRGMMWR